jgi:hypothetical protein
MSTVLISISSILFGVDVDNARGGNENQGFGFVLIFELLRGNPFGGTSSK